MYTLLHLNGTRGLAGEVIGDTAHTVDLVDDAGRDLGQELVAEGVGGGGHEVLGGDGAEEDDVGVHALVTHDTDGAGRVQSGIGLTDVVVQTGFADHTDKDVVGVTGGLDLLLGDLTQDTDSKTGAYIVVSFLVWGFLSL